jgi:hypothetical protein
LSVCHSVACLRTEETHTLCSVHGSASRGCCPPLPPHTHGAVGHLQHSFEGSAALSPAEFAIRVAIAAEGSLLAQALGGRLRYEPTAMYEQVGATRGVGHCIRGVGYFIVGAVSSGWLCQLRQACWARWGPSANEDNEKQGGRKCKGRMNPTWNLSVAKTN